MRAKHLVALAVVVAMGAVSACSWADLRAPDCDVCKRQIHGATHYRMHLENGQVKNTCCARCGLHYEQEQAEAEVVKREVADFDSGEFIDASEAVYVEGSSVHLCCEAMAARDRSGGQYALHWDRCLPSLVAFGTREAAARFAHEHGGHITDFDSLLREQ
ncbi:MAG TPA: hypothetical protein VLV83_17755 [Acidobacteriota bacterium]|nr:hypothetical protein [Acidobacteriota bacterium]